MEYGLENGSTFSGQIDNKKTYKIGIKLEVYNILRGF